MEVYLTRSLGSRRFRLLVLTDIHRSGFDGRVQIYRAWRVLHYSKEAPPSAEALCKV
jgi:hypothetical protein